MAEESLSEKLARRLVSLSLQELPDTVIQAAKLHILDSLGVTLAGSRLEAGRLAYELSVSLSGASAAQSQVALLGAQARVSLLDGVLAMASAAHCGEMDDIHSGAATCVGGMIIPALLAMAEKYGGSGAAFIEAAVAGYETTVRVGLAIDGPTLIARGWWPSALCGAFGVVAAGAKFLRWPVRETVNALGIAAIHAGGMLTGGSEGPTARHLLFGRSAQNGILALLAAQQGFSGPRYAFEEPRGFCRALCAEPKWNYLESGENFFLPEVAFKPFPCARQLHAGVEALLSLRREPGIAPEEIEEIELSVPAAVATMVNRPGPELNRAASLASGEYVMAVTAFRGKMDLASFDDEFFLSEEVRRLMAKVRVREGDDLNRYFPRHWPGRVRIKLSGDRSYGREVLIPKGERENPMSGGEIEEKFKTLAAPLLSEERLSAVIGAVRSLEKSDSLDPLLSALKA